MKKNKLDYVNEFVISVSTLIRDNLVTGVPRLTRESTINATVN